MPHSDLLDMYLVEPSQTVIKVHDPVEVDSDTRNKPVSFLVTPEQVEAMFACIRTSRSESHLKWCSHCFPDKEPQY